MDDGDAGADSDPEALDSSDDEDVGDLEMMNEESEGKSRKHQSTIMVLR